MLQSCTIAKLLSISSSFTSKLLFTIRRVLHTRRLAAGQLDANSSIVGGTPLYWRIAIFQEDENKKYIGIDSTLPQQSKTDAVYGLLAKLGSSPVVISQSCTLWSIAYCPWRPRLRRRIPPPTRLR
jgi:hypothetical protein